MSKSNSLPFIPKKAFHHEGQEEQEVKSVSYD